MYQGIKKEVNIRDNSAMDRPKPGSVEDLATLSKLDDNILLDELRIRYNNNQIYVSKRCF